MKAHATKLDEKMYPCGIPVVRQQSTGKLICSEGYSHDHHIGEQQTNKKCQGPKQIAQKDKLGKVNGVSSVDETRERLDTLEEMLNSTSVSNNLHDVQRFP